MSPHKGPEMHEHIAHNMHDPRDLKPTEEGARPQMGSHPRINELRPPSSERIGPEFSIPRRCDSPGLGAMPQSVMQEMLYVSKLVSRGGVSISRLESTLTCRCPIINWL